VNYSGNHPYVQIDLNGIEFSGNYFSRFDLRKTDLMEAILYSVFLSDADLSGAFLGFIVFVEVDLSTLKGLEMVEHLGPSVIGIGTIIYSRGKIPVGKSVEKRDECVICTRPLPAFTENLFRLQVDLAVFSFNATHRNGESGCYNLGWIAWTQCARRSHSSRRVVAKL